MKDNVVIGGKNSFVNIKSILDILLILATAVFLLLWILLTCFPNGWITQLKNMSYSASVIHSFGYGFGNFLLGFVLLIIYILIKLFVRWIMAWKPAPSWIIIFSKCILIIIICVFSFRIYNIYFMDVLEIVSYENKELGLFVKRFEVCKNSILIVLGIFIPSFIIHAYKFYRKQITD